MARFLAALVMVSTFAFGCNGQEVTRPDETVDGADSDGSVIQTVSDRAIPEPDSVTLRLFQQTMSYARENELHELPIGHVMTRLGERFVRSPYAAGMLDEPDEEKLICRLDAFDCVTFVEATLAMSRAIKQGSYDYDTYAALIRDQRYRAGEMDGYCSRLHYFTDWIADNERRRTVDNITREIGGEPLEKQLSFMSENRESYPRFATNDSLYQCIIDAEADLREVELFYIPEDRIAEAYGKLQAGDIIATATHIGGLDVTHTGLVYDQENGRKGLLHASTSGGVKVSPDLQSYVQGVGVTIGIIVARPLEPATS